MTKAADADPFFIVGPGRSGTTLMARLLSAHSRITVPPETHFMKIAFAEGAATAQAPADFQRFWSSYIRMNRFRELGVSPERCLEIIESLGERSFRNVLASVLRAHAEAVGKPRAGEKTPGHVRYLARLLEWFPRARVVIMMRDPRAVVASQLPTPWVPITPPSLRDGYLIESRISQVARYSVDWQEIEAAARLCSADEHVLIQTYEELVRDPEEALHGVCAFLGESFECGMLDHPAASAPRPAPNPQAQSELRRWREKHHARTNQPVSRDSLERWRNELSSTEVAIIEGICHRGMMAREYPAVSSASRQRMGALLGRGVLDGERWERLGRSAAARVLRPRRAASGGA